jgi:chaperonin GroEL
MDTKINFNSEGYYPKDLCFDTEAKDKLVSGIKKISQAVKSTIGPRGNTVLIESPTHTRGVVVTKDGVTVAKSIDLLDPVENLAVRLVKEAADKTANLAGDGTSSAVVLTEAITLAGMDYITPEINRTVVLRKMEEYTALALEYIKAHGLPVATSDDLRAVATISANNDTNIGGLIADLFDKVGKDGQVIVQKSKTHTTYTDVAEGVLIDRGATSTVFFNDQRKGQFVAENAKVLVCDMELSSVVALQGLFRTFVENPSIPLLIIAPVSQNFLSTIAANVIRNGMKICIIEPPSFGYRRSELMEDIAIATGAKLYSEKTGTDVTMMSVADLGTALNVVVSERETVITLPEQSDGVVSRITELKCKMEDETDKSQKEFLSSRISSLSGGCGTIYVGGKTDIEQKELYDRVDDAVCAVRSAIAEGITVGGGKALWNTANYLFDHFTTDGDDYDPEGTVAVTILSDAMKAPMITILSNAGLVDKYWVEMAERNSPLSDELTGIDAKTDEMVNLLDRGIVDPVKVVRCSLENAVSVALTILSTNGVVTMTRV